MAGTDEAIIMMEAEAKELSEDEILTVVQYGHEVIKDIVKIPKMTSFRGSRNRNGK